MKIKDLIKINKRSTISVSTLFISAIFCFVYVFPLDNNDIINYTFANEETEKSIIITYNKDITDAKKRTINTLMQTTEISKIEELDSEVLKIPNNKKQEEIIEIYKKNANVEYIEPNYKGTFDLIPNDPYYANLKALLTAINAQAGWDIANSGGPIIAVVDSGVYQHTDLPKLLPGYSAVTGLLPNNDTVGHGTGVAGTLGALGNNGIGTMGMNWNALILPVKVDDANGSLLVSNIAKGIIWAADNGAKIISLSVSTTSDSVTLKNAIDYAYSKGCALFSSVGNDGKNNLNYPSRYSNVMAVGASSNGTTRASISNYGVGMGVVAISSYTTTTASGNYVGMGGTSFSTPQVSGLASLILAVNPNLTNDEVYAVIEQGAKTLGGRYNEETGYGLIDMGKSLSIAQSKKSLITITTENIPGGIKNTNYNANIIATGGNLPYTYSVTGLPAGLTINANTGDITGIPSTSGNYTLNITIKDNSGMTGVKAIPLTIVASVDMKISTTNLPNGVVGSLYGQVITVTGGDLPYTYNVTGLPNGLSINKSSGLISGTPTIAGTSNINITVTDSKGTSINKTIALVITSAVTISTNSLPSGTVNTAYNATISCSGGTSPYTYSATSLPNGLAISSAGAISGKPTVSGSFNVTITAKDSKGTTNSKTLVMTINVASLPLVISTTSLPGGTVNSNYSYTLNATGGTSPYTYSASGLPSGLTISNTGVISGKPTKVSTSSVTITVKDNKGTNSSSKFTLSVVAASTPLTISTSSLSNGTVNSNYSLTLTASGGSKNYSWSAIGLPTGLSVNSTNGLISGKPTIGGSFNITIIVNDNNTSVSKLLTLKINGSPLIINTTSLLGGAVNVDYNASINVSGGVEPYTYSASGLPKGLSINSSTGLISGKPTTAGLSNITITVKDVLGSSISKSNLSLSVVAAPTPLNITTNSLSNGTVNSKYSANINASGGASSYSFKATSLPTGLTISTSGSISGTPTIAGKYQVAITVTDKNNNQITKILSLTINGSPLNITTSSIPDASLNKAYNVQINVSGGVGPFRFTASNLPSGLTINETTGLISGIPNKAVNGNISVGISVTDSLGTLKSTSYKMKVK